MYDVHSPSSRGVYRYVIIVVTGAIGGDGLTPAGPVLVGLIQGNIVLSFAMPFTLLLLLFLNNENY